MPFDIKRPPDGEITVTTSVGETNLPSGPVRVKATHFAWYPTDEESSCSLTVFDFGDAGEGSGTLSPAPAHPCIGPADAPGDLAGSFMVGRFRTDKPKVRHRGNGSGGTLKVWFC